MTNDSSTGGYLDPIGPAPVADDALDRALQAVVAGILPLDPTLVRPRWQPTAPLIPPATTDWCAIGVVQSDPEPYPAMMQDGDAAEGLGEAVVTRHETLTVMASLYGPNAKANADRLQLGFYVMQNTEPLVLNNIALVSVGAPVAVPELLNQVWRRRWDVPVTFRRGLVLRFGIRNIVSAEGSIKSHNGSDDPQDLSTTEWSVEEP